VPYAENCVKHFSFFPAVPWWTATPWRPWLMLGWNHWSSMISSLFFLQLRGKSSHPEGSGPCRGGIVWVLWFQVQIQVGRQGRIARYCKGGSDVCRDVESLHVNSCLLNVICNLE
jgi:hypothetical protein